MPNRKLHAKPMTQGRSAGFTLTELLVVVAILGLLSATALPAYQRYQNRAKVTQLLKHLSSYQNEISMCYNETGSFTQCTAGQRGDLYQIPENIVSSDNIPGVGAVTLSISGDLPVLSAATEDASLVDEDDETIKLTGRLVKGFVVFDKTGFACDENVIRCTPKPSEPPATTPTPG